MSRVLYIEDNPVNVLVVEELLAPWADVELVVAETGQAGLQALRNGPRPDLILLDLELPDGNGWDWLARIRQEAGGADLPCVALSAHEPGQMQARALAAGFVAYWGKPLDFAQFRRDMAHWLKRAADPGP